MTYRANGETAQLFVQICSKLATSPGLSNLFSLSASKSPLGPNPLIAPISTRALYVGISSLFAFFPLFRERVGGWYFPTPGISRASAEDAAAVIGLMCVWEWCEEVLEAWLRATAEARRKGSKCSFRRSNSSDSGAESSVLCSCSRDSVRAQRVAE